MFVVVALVLGVPMPVVQVVHMVTVLNGFVPTVRTVDVLVVGRVVLAVFRGACHLAPSFNASGSARDGEASLTSASGRPEFDRGGRSTQR